MGVGASLIYFSASNLARCSKSCVIIFRDARMSAVLVPARYITAAVAFGRISILLIRPLSRNGRAM